MRHEGFFRIRWLFNNLSLTQSSLLPKPLSCFHLPVRWPLLALLLPFTSCQEKDPWAGTPNIPTKISFNQDIRPLLTRECLQCHSEENAQAGLSLDRPSGVASVTSDNSPKKSLLWEKIVANHPVALPERDKAILWRWIKQGTPTEAHWAALPINPPSSRPPALSVDSTVDQQEFAFLARALFGRNPTPAEVNYNIQQQPPRGELIDSMMRQRNFADFFKTRLLLFSGARPVSAESVFAPYLRWLDTEIASPNFALDDFFRESLAGDLLPDSGQEGAIATAWTRIPHRAGIDSLSQRVAENLLALDITQPASPTDLWPSAAEVLPAFLPTFPPATIGDITIPPFLPVHTPQQYEALKVAQDAEPIAWQAAKVVPESATVNFVEWLAQEEPAVSIPDLAVAFSFDSASPLDLAPQPVASLRPPLTFAEGVQGTALAAPAQFEGLPLSSDRAFTFSFFLNLGQLPENESPLFYAQTTQGSPVGFRLNLSSDSLTITLLNGSSENSLAAKAQTLPQPGQWYHFAITYDGSRKAEGFQLWIDSQPIPLTTVNDSLYGIANAPAGHLRFQAPVADGPLPTLLDELQIYRSVLSEIEISNLRDGKALLAEVRDEFPREDLLFNYYLRSKSPVARDSIIRAVNASNEVSTLQDTALLVPIAGPTPTPDIRPTLPFYSLPMSSEPNRLGLANWLLDNRNPVTPRVLASRLYQMVHGVSLLPGEDISDPWQVPSQAALLDFLARDILVKEWNLRAILRTILLHPPQKTEPEVPHEFPAAVPI